MRSGSRLSWLLTVILLLTISGCGTSVESNNSGTLTLTVDPQMSLKGSVTAKATYTNSQRNGLQGLEISFSTNKPAIFGTRVVKTDTSGTATCVLTANSPVTPLSEAPTAPTVITLTASVGDLVQTQTFIVNPATITFTAPATGSFAGGGVAGSVLRIVPSGMFARVADGDGTPLNNIPVTISVDSIVNGSAGDVLFWSDFPGGTLSAPPSVFTKNTDADGQVPMQVTIDVVVPSVSHVVSVTWKASFTDPNSGATISKFASSGFTVTP